MRKKYNMSKKNDGIGPVPRLLRCLIASDLWGQNLLRFRGACLVYDSFSGAEIYRCCRTVERLESSARERSHVCRNQKISTPPISKPVKSVLNYFARCSDTAFRSGDATVASAGAGGAYGGLRGPHGPVTVNHVRRPDLMVESR